MTKSDNRNPPPAQLEALILETSTPVRAIPIPGIYKGSLRPQACEISVAFILVPGHILHVCPGGTA